VTKILEISSKAKLKPWQFLVPSFLLEPEKNPTIEWIERIKKENPNQKLSLLMGFDSFSGIESWIRSHDLLRLLDTLYVVSRLENDLERNKAMEKLEKLKMPKVIFLGKHNFENLSSKDLRKLLK
jgi:nicotinic acid mononucleotide adenylyltransferase